MSCAICRMRCWRSSAWTRISPIASLIEPRSLGALGVAPGQPDAVVRRRADAEALARGHAGHPGDLPGADHHGQGRAARARDLAVGEEVLERAAPAQPEGAHAVAR